MPKAKGFQEGLVRGIFHFWSIHGGTSDGLKETTKGVFIRKVVALRSIGFEAPVSVPSCLP